MASYGSIGYERDERELVRVVKLDAFGPAAWILLHSLALRLPRNSAVAAARFVTRVRAAQKAMGCPHCRRHLGEMLRLIPPRLYTPYGRVGMVALMYVYHCVVNSILRRRNPAFLVEEGKLLRELFPSPTASRILRELRRDADAGLRASIREDIRRGSAASVNYVAM